MTSALNKIRLFLENLKDENIIFKRHFHDRTMERPISESLIKEHLKKSSSLFDAEEQPAKREGEEKYRLWFRLSNRYSLAVVVTIFKKDLYIITA